MSRWNRRFIVLALALGSAFALSLALAPAPARADFQIIQTRNTPALQTDWSVVVANDPLTNQPRPFDQFHPQPGLALKNVVISVAYWYYSVIDITFNTPGTITVSTLGALGVHDPTDKPLLTVFPLFTHTETKTVAAASPLSPQSFEFVQSPPAYVQAAPIVLTAGTDDLSPYIGNGFLNFPIGARAQTTFMDTSGNGFAESHTYVSAVITILFTVVPEPASALLLVLGGASLLLGRSFLRRFPAPRTDH